MKIIKNLKAEELRKSILQLAIQGKLVKQDPNDEPASELAKKIKKEKEKLILEGKIKKEKEESFIFKGDDNCYYEKIGKNESIKLEDLPFEIPENWTWVRLKNIFSINAGATFKKEDSFKDYKEGMIRILRGGNILLSKYILKSDDIYIPDKLVSKNILLNIYDLITPVVSSLENIGKIAIIDSNLKDITVGGFVYIFRLYFKNKTISNIVHNFICSPHFQNTLKNITRKSGQAFYNLGKEKLSELYLPIPPLAEQERIVKKIQSLDLLIQQYNEYETKLTKLESEFEEKLKKSILQYAIQGKLVKQDPNDEPASELIKKIYDEKQKLILEGKIKQDKYESHIYQGTNKNYYEKIDENEPIKLEDLPFKIPENWTWVRFSNFVNLELGHTPSRDMNENWQPGKYPWFSISDMKDKKNIYFSKEKISELAFKKYFSSKLVPKNTLLMSFKLTIGRVSLLGVNATHNEAITSISPYLDQNNYIKIYLFNILGTLVNFVSQTQAIKGKILNKEKLKKMFMPVPSLKEISKINNKIRLFFNLIK